MKPPLLKFAFLLTNLLLASLARGGTNNITVAWTASTDPNAGYNVYWGTESGVYDQVVDAHHQTSKMVLHLTVYTRYYFAVTAYNQNGDESAYSDEISVVVPPVGSTPTPTPTPLRLLPPLLQRQRLQPPQHQRLLRHQHQPRPQQQHLVRP